MRLLDFGGGKGQDKGKRGREKYFLAMYKQEALRFNRCLFPWEWVMGAEVGRQE